IVHAHGNAGAWEVEYLVFELVAVLAFPLDRELAGARDQEIGRLVLVAECVTADDDRVGPARDDPRHVGDDDRFAKYDSAKDVADGAVRRLPHLLEAEL